MTTYPIVFVIRAERGQLDEALAMVEKIKKIHPEAHITVEAEA